MSQNWAGTSRAQRKARVRDKSFCISRTCQSKLRLPKSPSLRKGGKQAPEGSPGGGRSSRDTEPQTLGPCVNLEKASVLQRLPKGPRYSNASLRNWSRESWKPWGKRPKNPKPNFQISTVHSNTWEGAFRLSWNLSPFAFVVPYSI